MTRIFKVDYSYGDYENGKYCTTVRDSANIVAKDAPDAITKVFASLSKPTSYISDETKKKISVERKNIDVVGVTLLAETT